MRRYTRLSNGFSRKIENHMAAVAIDLETHQAVFTWVLHQVADAGLVKSKTIGIDATMLEANAALRTIVRRDTGETYDDFLTRLAQASGIETPTREDLARIDRKRKNNGSNDDWTHPHDPDATITKMKDGRTHLAHKAEHRSRNARASILHATSGSVIASPPLLRWPGGLGHGCQRRPARRPGGNIVDHELLHPRAGVDRAGPEMREEHDVIHLEILLRHLRLIEKHVEAGGIDPPLLQRLDQGGIVDNSTA
jgi:hypothetical protein